MSNTNLEVQTRMVSRSKNARLIHRSVSGSNEEKTFFLLDLYDHESDLDKGRFGQFSATTQEYKVPLPIRAIRSIQEALEWVATKCDGTWSLKIEADDYVFSFENPTPAVMIRLMY